MLQGQQLLEELPVVGQARDLVLAAQLASTGQPVVEESRTGYDHFERLEGDLLVAFGLIIGIDRLQRLV